MTRYFFPLMFLRPDAEWDSVESLPFRMARRLWGTSTFDLATLATRHRLHLPYQVMDVMLSRCNLEVRIEADRVEQAVDYLHTLLLGLYVQGVSPTVAPFATAYSINEYSGINSRDSESLREKLPQGLRNGLTSDEGTLEAWPVHLSLHCHLIPERVAVTPDLFRAGSGKALEWHALEAKQPELRVVRDAAQAAPLLLSTDQSLLHVWCALEARFPRVSVEVSFRLALYLAQLSQRGSRRDLFGRAREAYNLRSRVAHGSKRGVTHEEWSRSWLLLMEAANAVLDRGLLPEEEALLAELLSSGEKVT